MKTLEKLKELVKIRSDENCDLILEFIKNQLMNKVEEVKIFGSNKKILIAGINTNLKDVNPIVLAGHIDTVKANEQQYNTNPYELTIINGKAYGLGSIDMKSFTAIILDKLEEIKKIDYPIIFALTSDEETELISIELLIETLKNLNIKPNFTIIGEPTNSKFNLCSNACYEYKVKIYGKACHSSILNQGTNAICACAKLVSFIEENQKNYKLTSNCGVIKGGEVVNKVPDYAELTFDIRSIYLDDIKQFELDINEFSNLLTQQYNDLKVEIINTLAIPAFNKQKSEKIQNIAQELELDVDSFSGGCEAGYYTEYSGDAVIFGVGDLALAHKPNEFVDVSEYGSYSAKLISLLQCLTKYYPLKSNK